MQRRRVVLVFLLILTAVSVAGVMYWPSLHVGFLANRLSSADDPKEAARIAKKILDADEDRGAAVLANYVAANPLSAFDNRHRVLVIHDPETCKTYTVYPELGWVEDASNDPALAEAFADVLPEITTESVTVGDPPLTFLQIEVSESTEDYVDFALKAADKKNNIRLRLTFESGSVVMSGVHPGSPR